MLLLIAAIILYRYYAKQREELNAVFVVLRENVAEDVLAVYNAGKSAGQQSRSLVQEYGPKAVALYNAAKEAVQSRLPQREES